MTAAALCRAASVALIASSAAVWLTAAGEMCDWGRFRAPLSGGWVGSVFVLLGGLVFPLWAAVWKRHPDPAGPACARGSATLVAWTGFALSGVGKGSGSLGFDHRWNSCAVQLLAVRVLFRETGA